LDRTLANGSPAKALRRVYARREAGRIDFDVGVDDKAFFAQPLLDRPDEFSYFAAPRGLAKLMRGRLRLFLAHFDINRIA
jgi:hypothetical protein